MVQCSNNGDAVPVFPGDTRVVVIHVNPIKNIIPKGELIKFLEDEAADFTTELLDLEIPRSLSRLRIPIVVSQEKIAMADSNMPDIDRFIQDCVFEAPGYAVALSDVWDLFCELYSPENMSKHKFNKEFQTLTGCLKGRYGSGAQWHWGNIYLEEKNSNLTPLKMEGDMLR